jgi:hypothetical protein
VTKTPQGTTYIYTNGSLRGAFAAKGDGEWEERAADGVYHFREQSADSGWIYLRDDSRNINVRIPVGGGLAGFRWGPLLRESTWNDLYTVSLSSNAQVNNQSGNIQAAQQTIFAAGNGVSEENGSGGQIPKELPLNSVKSSPAPAPTIAAFEAALAPGEPCAVILRWTVKGATSASIEPTLGPVDPASGYRVVRPLQTMRYSLRAEGPGGTANRDVTISVSNTMKATCGQ